MTIVPSYPRHRPRKGAFSSPQLPHIFALLLLAAGGLAACSKGTDDECCPPDATATDGSSGDGSSGDGAPADAGPDACTPCDDDGSEPRADFLFATRTTTSCNMASPIVHPLEGGGEEIVVVALDGLIRGIDTDTGEERWRTRLQAPEGQTPIVLATPALLGDTLFLAWQNAVTEDGLPDHGKWRRESHVVEAFSLTEHAPDPRWPRLTLAASVPAYDGGSVEFDSRFQLLRSAVQHVEVDDLDQGLLYVSVGNGPSIQPFHGWIFELDLDAWQSEGTTGAISGTLLTTASNDCTPDDDASAAMVCGGGVWTPSGVLINPLSGDDYEILVPTGNGRMDFDRRAYSHSVLRTGRGLPLEPGCDDDLCTPFDEFDPSRACLQSCTNLFAARMPEGEQLMPDHDLCDGKTFLECYGQLDADLGSSAPVQVQVPDGPRVFVQPGKDGGLYLFDAEHMGTLYDRVQALEMCGTADTDCPAWWTGHFVTTPVVSEVDGAPVVLVSGFNYDDVHPAGVVAYKVVLDGGRPAFELLWQAPDPESDDAVEFFRRHTGRPVLIDHGGEPYLVLVEANASGGHLWILRVRDGKRVQRLALESDGLKYTRPAIVDDMLFIGTCDYGALASGRLEAFRIADANEAPEDGVDPLDGGLGEDDSGKPICEPGGLSCDDTQYCERDWCGGPGLCRDQPAECAAESTEPVCGCDGLAYDSACAAHQAGATVDPDNPGSACPGSDKCWDLEHGCDQCSEGYVWRGIPDAPEGDPTCVTPAAKERTQQENADHESHVDADGDCEEGYVPRQAFEGDEICVTPEARDRAAQENEDHFMHTVVGASE